MRLRVVWCHLWSEVDACLCCAALVFHGIGVFEVGLAVFLGRFEFLVQHMLICGQPFASMDREALVRVLKSRLKPIGR